MTNTKNALFFKKLPGGCQIEKIYINPNTIETICPSHTSLNAVEVRLTSGSSYKVLGMTLEEVVEYFSVEADSFN